MEPAIQQGFAYALMAFLGTAIGMVISYLKDRDKLKYSETLKEQQVKITNLEVVTLKCEEDRAREREDCNTRFKKLEQYLGIKLDDRPEPKDDTGTHLKIM